MLKQWFSTWLPRANVKLAFLMSLRSVLAFGVRANIGQSNQRCHDTKTRLRNTAQGKRIVVL
jgi:hypothetical protein